jgi:hypothetical protein
MGTIFVRDCETDRGRHDRARRGSGAIADCKTQRMGRMDLAANDSAGSGPGYFGVAFRRFDRPVSAESGDRKISTDSEPRSPFP